MRSILLIIVYLISSISISQEINVELKNELKLILLKDQGIRELVGGGIAEERKQDLLKELSITNDEFLEYEGDLFEKIDSVNFVVIERIIKEYGYPGKSLVGEPENEAAWFVIQHSEKIEKYFPLIKKAGLNGELKMTKVAMMEDRMLMYRGEPQIYGTQAKGIFKVQNPTKQEDFFYIIWPIKNPNEINKLRKIVGFNSTIEDYAKQLGIEYRIYTIEEINKLIIK